MQIIKPLQLGVLHKSFSFLDKDIFCVSIPIAFSLIDNQIMLEQTLWSIVGEQIGNDIFDMGMPKETGEVLVCGNFIAGSNKAVKAATVHLQVSVKDERNNYQKQVDKNLAIFGDRHWVKLLGADISPSAPESIVEMPIIYQNAYGGEGYKLNPDGKGFKPVQTETGEKHFLPNIEYKNQLLISASKQPQPASFGRIDLMWEQRLSKAGTYDQKYIEQRMPGLPDDINWKYFNDAADDQWLNDYFKGDEEYSITNMHAEHATLHGQLPPIYGRAFVNQMVFNNQTHEQEIQFKEIPTKLDTLWLFPNSAMGVMIYRGSITAYADDGCDIKALLLACESRHDSPRSMQHYQEQLTKRLDPDHGYKYALYSSPLIAQDMTCGFKQIQDEADFPLEMLSKKNLDGFAEAKKNVAVLDAKSQLIEQCKAAGLDPSPYLAKIDNPEKAPEQIKIEALLEKMAPGMVTDPGNIEIFNIDLSVMDEIKDYTEEIKEQKIAETKAQISQEIQKLKADKGAHLIAAAIADLEQKLKEIDMPPMWPRPNLSGQLLEVKKQIADTEAQIDELRKQGIPENQLPKIEVDIDKIEAQLLDAEVRLKQTYAMGAHFLPTSRSPHPEKETQLRQAFIHKLTHAEPLANGDYACIDLSGIDLSGANLSGCYLEGVNFTGCIMSEVNLSSAILTGANLTNAKLLNCNCEGANVGNANLTNTKFMHCNLDKAQLGNSVFFGTQIINCVIDKMDFIDTRFEKTLFTDTSMKQCNFINPIFSECEFLGADLSQSNFVKPVFNKADFSNSKLSGANFVEAQANGSNFSHAQMINVRFVGACDLNNSQFVSANISQACLRESQLYNCNFSDALLDEADFSGANLEQSIFIGANANRTQFIKANLKSANLSKLNLIEGSLYKAYLVDAKFDHANLYCVNFMDATLGNNTYKGANLDQTILKDWRP